LRDQHEQELAFTDTEATKAEEAIERYLGAFEAGTLSEAQCGARLAKLGTKITDLRSRREELLAAMDQASAEVANRRRFAHWVVWRAWQDSNLRPAA
jgi:site-specific DNA recombinase